MRRGGPTGAKPVTAARRWVRIEPTRCTFPAVHLRRVTAGRRIMCGGSHVREFSAATVMYPFVSSLKHRLGRCRVGTVDALPVGWSARMSGRSSGPKPY